MFVVIHEATRCFLFFFFWEGVGKATDGEERIDVDVIMVTISWVLWI